MHFGWGRQYSRLGRCSVASVANHSHLYCPRTAQSTADNPPMLLPCGHCICKLSILKIAKAPNRTFKCPYCPAECTQKDCQELVMPDLQ